MGESVGTGELVGEGVVGDGVAEGAMLGKAVGDGIGVLGASVGDGVGSQ